MDDKRKLKMKEQIVKRHYKQVSYEFYDEIREVMIAHYLNNNWIKKEQAEDYTLLECIKLMPILKPKSRACFYILQEIFCNDDLNNKERVWRILKNYKKIISTFEN